MPTWLKLPAWEIVNVDWSSKDHVINAIADFKDPRIKITRVKNEAIFIPAKVWNLAISYTVKDFILKIDGDILLKPKRIAKHPLGRNTFYVGAKDIHGPGTFGTMFMAREMFTRANGYNERLAGWGYEDNDFVIRLVKHGYMINRWDKKSLRHIDHDDSIRFPKKNQLNKYVAVKLPWTTFDILYKPEIEYIE